MALRSEAAATDFAACSRRFWNNWNGLPPRHAATVAGAGGAEGGGALMGNKTVGKARAHLAETHESHALRHSLWQCLTPWRPSYGAWPVYISATTEGPAIPATTEGPANAEYIHACAHTHTHLPTYLHIHTYIGT